jgi:hypothetical protein
LQLQQPLAAWASWQKALRLSPDQAAARQAVDVLASAADLPAAARTVYRFRTPAGEDRRACWNARLEGRDLSDLALAADAFRELADADSDDQSAHYNHALCLAWKGANAAAIAALDRLVALEAITNPDQAADDWALADVLRQGAGAETFADDLNHSMVVDRHSGDGELSRLGTMLHLEPPIDPNLGRPRFKDVQAFEWLDRPMPAASPSLMLSDLPHVLATVIQTPRSLRLSGPDPVSLAEAQTRLGQSLDDPTRSMRREATPLPFSLLDAAAWTFRLPPGLDLETCRRLTRASIERYYETVWIHCPRHSLDEGTPLEAAKVAARGDRIAGAKLAGVISFREQLGSRSSTSELYGGYPFDRLRRRLGLAPFDTRTLDPGDISSMSGPELDALSATELDDFRLAEACESASGLRDDARTSQFATEILARGHDVLARLNVDRPRLFATLVRHALAQHDSAQALAWLDRAIELENNETSDDVRRTYDSWRAEVLLAGSHRTIT